MGMEGKRTAKVMTSASRRESLPTLMVPVRAQERSGTVKTPSSSFSSSSSSKRLRGKRLRFEDEDENEDEDEDELGASSSPFRPTEAPRCEGTSAVRHQVERG